MGMYTKHLESMREINQQIAILGLLVLHFGNNFKAEQSFQIYGALYQHTFETFSLHLVEGLFLPCKTAVSMCPVLFAFHVFQSPFGFNAYTGFKYCKGMEVM